jgi:hypothetical protein
MFKLHPMMQSALKKILQFQVIGVPLSVWLFLSFICIIGYWPISFNIFSLKNDAYIYFLPCRYFVSDSIHAGYWPLWNPYFYMGFPIHGDMQAGMWNPIVLFISFFTRYNITILQYETLLYIILGGIGTYKLSGLFAVNKWAKLIAAVSYMFCGFILDTGQITVWTGSAAFIPFCFFYYTRILYQADKSYLTPVKAAIAFYFLLTAGYPSYFIFTVYILCAATFCYYINAIYTKKIKYAELLHLSKRVLLLIIIFSLVSLPALLSYLDYLPYYQRSSGTSLIRANENPFDFFALISYFFPLSVTKDHYLLTTDYTARSAFIGIIPLLFLPLLFRIKRITAQQYFIGITIVVIFLFSLGDTTPVRAIFYDYFPLMKHFRHPASVRIFIALGLLLLSSSQIDFYNKNFKKNNYLKYTLFVFLSIISFVIIYYLFQSSLINKLSSFTSRFSETDDKRAFLKSLYDSIQFPDAIILEGIIEILFLILLIAFSLKSSSLNIKRLCILSVLNVITLAQFSLPSTFVTKQSPAVINQIIRESPKTYPIPDLNETVAQNTTSEYNRYHIDGCPAFFTKKLVLAKDELNPSFTQSLKDFDADTVISKIVLNNPVCYLADTVVNYARKNYSYFPKNNNGVLFTDSGLQNVTKQSNDRILIKEFAPGSLQFETSTATERQFVLFQVYNDNWKLLIDGLPHDIKKGNKSFIYADVPAGSHTLLFQYKPGYLKPAILVSIISVILILLFLIKSSLIKSSSLS